RPPIGCKRVTMSHLTFLGQDPAKELLSGWARDPFASVRTEVTILKRAVRRCRFVLLRGPGRAGDRGLLAHGGACRPLNGEPGERALPFAAVSHSSRRLPPASHSSCSLSSWESNLCCPIHPTPLTGR